MFGSQRKSKRDYLNDYKKTVNGDYIYDGAEYDYCSKSGKSRKRWLTEMAVLNVLAFICVIVPGFMLVPGMNYCWYVLLPYAAELVLLGYLLTAIIRIAWSKEPVKAWDYDKVIANLSKNVKRFLAVIVIALICEIVYLIINGAGGHTVGAVVYLVCHAVSVASMVLMTMLTHDVEWKLRT